MAKIWKHVVTNIKKEKMMSISNIAIMTVTFTLLGVFLSIIVVTQTTMRFLEQQAQITLFFKDDFSEQNILSFKNDLEKDKRISGVKYVSKEDAYKIFSEVNKDEPLLLESVTPSILPASLEIKTVDLKDFSPLANDFKNKDGVEEVRYFQDVIEKFRMFTTVAYLIGGLLVAAFVLISYSVIISMFRSTINSKGIELEILKLVGASDSYVRKPLLLQGFLFGLVSSVLASLLVSLLIMTLIAAPSDLMFSGLYLWFKPKVVLSPAWFSLFISFLLVMSGCLLGYFGSNSAVKKYLKY